MRRGVFVFTFNEDKKIVKKLFLELKKTGFFKYLILVDDGSNIDYKSVDCDYLLRHSRNLGIGFSRNSAFKLARKLSLDEAVFLDGDGQHFPREIAKLLLSSRDLVIGSRFKDNTEFFLKSTTFLRRIAIKLISLFLREFTGLHITDPTSGFRAYSKRAINFFSQIEPLEYPEPVEILLAYQGGLTIDEVGVEMGPRLEGKSSFNFFSSFYYMIDIIFSLFLKKKLKE